MEEKSTPRNGEKGKIIMSIDGRIIHMQNLFFLYFPTSSLVKTSFCQCHKATAGIPKCEN